MKEFVLTRWKGFLLCLCIAVPSWAVVLAFSKLEVIGAPVIAIVAGMIVAAAAGDRLSPALRPGIQYTSKKILQYAVILLGFGLNLATLGKVGASSLPIILSTILVSLIVAFVLSRVLHIEGKIATLVGVGSSICGGSAIAATAPVVGADDEQIAQAISVIFLFNVIAALIFPTLGGVLGLSNEGFGLFAGTAVNDTSSVTAAASTWDTLHGTNGMVLEYATIVKLTRTLAIIPITLILALWRARTEQARQKVTIRQVFPMFILYFVLASVITTVLTAVLSGGALGAANTAFRFLKQLSKFCIVLAMAAIGLGTDVVKLVKTGGKPILLGFCCWVAIACVSLGMQHLLGLF